MKPFVLPETKLNALAQSISQQMIEQHPFEGAYLLGEALKDFSEHAQINKFLIFQVFQVWEMQTSKLRHPFFDVDHDEVQASLKALQNVLSRHIRIARDDFQPMLQRAVYNHLKLLLDPVASFSSFFFLDRDSIPRSLYQRYVPYFPDYKVIVNSILKYHEKYEKETVEKGGFFRVLAKVLSLYNQRSEKSFEAYRKERFEALTGRSFEAVKAEAEAEKRAEAEARAREEAEARKQREEEEKKQAEAEAQAKAEAERQAAEAARRQAEAEARRRQEEAAKKQSFFDSVIEEDEPVALDFEEDLLGADPAPVAEPKPEPVAEAPVEPEPEPVAEVPAEPEPEPEPVAETPAEPEPEAEPVAEAPAEPEPEVEPIAETPAEPEPEVEPIAETPAEPEPVHPPQPQVVPISEAPAEPDPEPASEPEPVAQTPATPPVAESAPQPEPEPEEKEFDEMAANLEPTHEAAEPKADKESTASYLTRFLAKKQENQEEAPTVTEREANKEEEKKPSILDKLSRQSKEEELTHKPSLVESLNGSRQIKLDEIPIHKQYQFVQKVFEGNNVRFRIIVDKVNNAKNKAEVEDILDKFVLSNNDLNQDDKVVAEFIALLRNRY